MKIISLSVVCLLLFYAGMYAQKSSGRSNIGSLRTKAVMIKTLSDTVRQEEGIAKPVNRLKLPDLAGSVSFSEPSGNKYLDGGEQGKLIFTLSNKGNATAHNLQLHVTQETEAPGIEIGQFAVIDSLAPSVDTIVEIPLAAKEDVENKQVKFKVSVTETKGFDLDPPLYVTFSVRPLDRPQLIVADIGIDDFNKNGQIEPKELVNITARVQNRGEAEAEDVKAKIVVGDNVFFDAESDSIFAIGNLVRGAYKDITFSLYTNNRATGVPITIHLDESKRAIHIDSTISLAFNKPQKKATELVIEGMQSAPEAILDVATLSVDVDVNVPKSKNVNPDAIAIILGIEEYRNIAGVTYAKRDASVFKEYATKVLGVTDDRNHLYFRTDGEVTKGEFDKLFSEEGWLTKRVEQSSDVYIYYAGHGAPDIQEKMAYLIPFDGDANYPKLTGFSLNMLFDELAKLKVRSVTIFLDACFSGVTRENKMLLADARPISIVIASPILKSDNIIAMSAAGSDQISSGYPDKKHGLFTYFLLKGLRGDADKNKDQQITVGEIEEYLIENVKKTAERLDREQTPQVMGKNRSRVLVKY